MENEILAQQLQKLKTAWDYYQWREHNEEHTDYVPIAQFLDVCEEVLTDIQL